MATKFKTRPRTVEAFKWMEDQVPEWWRHKEGIQIDVSTGIAYIPNHGGVMSHANKGDYIFLWFDGEIKTADPKTFEQMFEAVEEEK